MDYKLVICFIIFYFMAGQYMVLVICCVKRQDVVGRFQQ